MTENRRKGKLSVFLRRQGFTIALAICLLAICATAIWAATNSEEPEPNLSVIERKDESLEAKASPAPSATQTPEPSQTAKQATVVLVMPADGNVIRGFSSEELVFFKTLNTWATHNGIDIACGDDKNVRAALKGEVESVVSDQLGGIIVTIAHADNQKTIYSGLSEASVKAKDSVETGQVIGTVGTPSFEAADGEHLHFEYTVKGKYVDPTKYFSQNK